MTLDTGAIVLNKTQFRSNMSNSKANTGQINKANLQAESLTCSV